MAVLVGSVVAVVILWNYVCDVIGTRFRIMNKNRNENMFALLIYL